EAMACGLPVVASHLRVYREDCEDAALYFPAFLYGVLAKRVVTVLARTDVKSRLVQAGIQRSADFSWNRHVSELLQIAESFFRGCLERGLVRSPIGNQRLNSTA